MLKFRCQHCGQRIAVPARHLGKLVTCAECGQVTHPLAEQIVKAKEAAAPPAAPSADAAPAPEATPPCANCGKPIGVLQATHAWQAQRVCSHCYQLLSTESSTPGLGRTVPALVARVAPQVERPTPPSQLNLRERVIRGLMFFVVAVVALYGALTLLRDIAGLIAVTAVAVLALVALYAVFRVRLGTRAKSGTGALTAPTAP